MGRKAINPVMQERKAVPEWNCERKYPSSPVGKEVLFELHSRLAFPFYTTQGKS